MLYLINKAKKVMPYTFFIQMGIIGNFNKNGKYVSKHMDKEDLVIALFHVGDPQMVVKLNIILG